MSWIVGMIAERLGPGAVERLAAVHPAPLHRMRTEGLYVAAGGLEATCHAGDLPAPEGGGWAVVGTGFVPGRDGVRLLPAMGWAALLAAPDLDLRALDGPFAGVRWRDGTLFCFTDAVGLRSLYLARTPAGVVFSTRLDWVSRLAARHEVDLAAFGAHWLAFNQLAARSLVAGVERLGPGGTAGCTARSVEVRHAAWHPGPPSEAPFDLLGQLEPFLHPRRDASVSLSLGLSGGLDSRLLLALLVRGGAAFGLHVFGPPEDPDVRVSRAIASAEGLPQVHLAAEVPPAEACLRLLEDYASQACASTPASAAVKLSTYGALHARGQVVIDGGFGEVARRQFFNRLLRRGPRDLAHGRPEALLPHVRVHRADVFAPEAEAAMRRGFAEDAALLLDAMPRSPALAPADYLDLVAIRTRLPNFYGYGQPRLDEQAVNYMPFAQPSFLRHVLATPLRDRQEGRLFRRAIRAHAPALAAYPLVKGGTTYPFPLTTVPAWLWTKAKARAGARYRDRTAPAFLDVLSGYVRDLVRSEATRSYAAYDYPKLLATVERYYGGEAALAPAVDWWLAFETWRRALGKVE